MPIYEYRCECGAQFEAIEKLGTARTVCGEECVARPARGDGKVERIPVGAALRGVGHDASEPSVDLRKRAGRWWDDCA